MVHVKCLAQCLYSIMSANIAIVQIRREPLRQCCREGPAWAPLWAAGFVAAGPITQPFPLPRSIVSSPGSSPQLSEKQRQMRMGS